MLSNISRGKIGAACAAFCRHLTAQLVALINSNKNNSSIIIFFQLSFEGKLRVIFFLF